MSIDKVVELLEQEYGPREWQTDSNPVAVLIRTILSQNTSDINSGRAFESLQATFGSWEAVASAPVEHIAQAIKMGGLFRVKAARIKKVLNEIERKQGGISLDFLGSLDMDEARDYLLRLSGVGQKTASCVLLFALGKPSLPVDTHVFRVARRLGLLDPKASLERSHSVLQDKIPPSKVYQFHLHMIEHGRRVCHARQPCCSKCVLTDECPSSLVSLTFAGAQQAEAA